MNHFQKLPHELQVNIFNRIKDKAQLAACRLVCKQWDSIAERAIFSKELVIKDDENFITKLYNHLANKPAVALLIKNIQRSLLCKKLLQLVMTPSLEQIQGYVSQDTKNLIYQIVLSSPHKFNRIKRIPVQEESDLCRKCLYALRDSLEYMRLSIDVSQSNIVQDHLNEFTKLDYLHLNSSNIQGIMELDLTLRRLRNITKLELWVAFKAENYTPKSSDQMADWLAQNVEKDQGMKSIDEVIIVEKEYWSNLVEYLTYKYPNLHFLKLDFMVCLIDVERILRATTHIPHLLLELSAFNNANDLRTLGYMMKSSSNIVKITYEDGDYCIEEACRDNSIQLSKFSVNLPPEADFTYARQLLSAVGSGTSKITKAAISFGSSRDQDSPQNASTLYDILRLTPDVQDLEFSDPTIEYQELGSGDLVLHDLQHIKFRCSRVDHRVITQLGIIAPNLDRLTLSDSLVFGRERNYDVVMPDSNLGFITIYFSNFWAGEGEFELTDDEADDTDESIYLSIKTELYPGTYYVWRPDNLITTTSKEEFDIHAAPKLSAHIECKSLSSLSLEHDISNITMQFERGVLLKSY
ncbi:hypothetical protein MBANPS3_007763 [Mucor bainieri]